MRFPPRNEALSQIDGVRVLHVSRDGARVADNDALVSRSCPLRAPGDGRCQRCIDLLKLLKQHRLGDQYWRKYYDHSSLLYQATETAHAVDFTAWACPV